MPAYAAPFGQTDTGTIGLETVEESRSPILAQVVLLLVLVWSMGLFEPQFTRPFANLQQAIILEPEFQDLARGSNNVQRQQALAQSDWVNQAFWISMGALMLFAVMRQPQRFWRIFGGQWPLILLTLYAMLSSLWALAPDIAFRRSVFVLIVFFVIAACAAYVRSPTRMITVLYISFWLMLAETAFALPRWQSYDDFGLFRGFMSHKNILGHTCGVAFVVGLAYRRFLHGFWPMLLNLVYLAIALSFALIAYSKTALQLIVVVPAVLFGITIASRIVRVSSGTIFFFGLLFLTSVIWVSLSGLGDQAEDWVSMVVEDTTLTGRTDIWAFMWTKIPDKIFFGYGYQSFWAIGTDSINQSAPEEWIRRLNQGHSGYLDLLATLGIVGLLIAAPILWRFDRASTMSRSLVPVGHFMGWAIVLYALFTNVLESLILAGSSSIWVWMLVGFMVVERAHYEAVHNTVVYDGDDSPGEAGFADHGINRVGV